MTQERFFQIVDDPDLLRRITYEELKTLALAYPYAHNLRCLLALKARQIDHADAVQTLATAAAYSLDRTQLFLLVAPQVIVPQQALAPEEVLELKPIETVKRELEALSPLVREEKNFETAQVSEALPPSPPETAAAPEAPDTQQVQAGEVPQSEPGPVENTPRQQFSEWMEHFKLPILEARIPSARTETISETFEEEEKEAENKKAQGIAQQLAERSVAENQDVISETLAKLYAKQGYRDKAAQMYARLALLFPEKSAYFAAEIDKLKK